MASDRMSFDEACRDLGITEAELENLVASGEVASIKEGDTVYFKRDVVRKLKEQREHEPTILLSDDEINLLDDSVEEIDLLADDDATTRSKAKPSAAREELPEIDLGGDEEEKPAPARKKEGPKVTAKKAQEPEGEETLLNLDGMLEEDSEATTPVPASGGDDATMLDTDLLDLSSEADPFAADTAEETSATDLTEAGTLLRSGGARVMQMKRKTSTSAWTSILAVACVLLVLPMGVLTSLMFAASGDAKTVASEKQGHWAVEHNYLEPIVDSLADFFKPAR